MTEQEIQALIEERDALKGEKDQIAAERDALKGEKDQITAERDALKGEKDQITAERDEIKAKYNEKFGTGEPPAPDNKDDEEVLKYFKENFI